MEAEHLRYPELQANDKTGNDGNRNETGGTVNPAFELELEPAGKSEQCSDGKTQRKNVKGRNGSANGTKGSSQDETSSDSSQFPEFLNYGEEDEMEIEGYKLSMGRTVVTWIFIMATAGLLRLIFHWWPHLMLKATHCRCSLNEAEKVLVIEQYQQKYKRYYVKTVYSISSDLLSPSCRQCKPLNSITSNFRRSSSPTTGSCSSININLITENNKSAGDTSVQNSISSPILSPAEAGMPSCSSSGRRVRKVPTSNCDFLGDDDEIESLSTLTTSLDDRDTNSVSGCGGGATIASGVETLVSNNNNNELSDNFCNLPTFKSNLGQMSQNSSSLLRFFSNVLRYCCCSCLYSHNPKERSRTTKLFAAAGLRTTQVDGDANRLWDQKLEEELKTIASPKLAIPKADGNIREADSVRLFTCKKLRYIWDDQYGGFTKLQGFDIANTNTLHQSKGLSLFQQCQRRIIYGNNEIKVEVQSIIRILFLEVLNPFYVFQIFSITLWLTDGYIYFAVAIIVMSIAGIASTIVQTRKNEAKLQATVQSSDIVKVCRAGGEHEDIPTEHLVPGDVIVIPAHGYTLHCDAVLLSGNCIVNESMLTGESVPVTKISLPNRNDICYNTKEHARHTLFCGTHIIQTRYYGHEPVLAVVLRSGFLTAKGSLVRSIMYPPPVDYRFERDSYKFVAVLALIAVCGFAYSVYLKVLHGVSLRSIIIDSLDLITIVVPPALPAAMTVGRLYAQRRLKRKGIYCISPRAINVAGSLDCVCFDKTGTLTEEGLDMWGIVPTTIGSGMGLNYQSIYPSLDISPGYLPPLRNVNHLTRGPLLTGMSACHSLTRIDGILVGDPLDLKMFEWTNCELEEPGVADNEKFDMVTPTIVRPATVEVNDNVPSGKPQNGMDVGGDVGIVRQFPFSSSLQRMSVITRRLGAAEFELYCKGSPEMIASLSLPETVPENFTATLERYTQHGYRVIAMGYRKLSLNYAKCTEVESELYDAFLKANRVVREEVECQLIFLGLIVLENRLKPETTPAIEVHKKAGIRTVMVTGDNMLTAISVARECQMIEKREKVIVVTTEADTAGVEVRASQKQSLFFNYETKSGSVDAEGTQSPGSVGSGCGSLMEQNLINMEAPANRYHFAITGNAFTVAKTFYSEIFSRLLVRGTVFARMNPEQKQQLVEHLQSLGYYVAMCGDGANDCGALKAAHAGISLSEAESSVASPFTSKEANITCVQDLIREGRAALVTSFGIFKYMAIYSLTQFMSVIVLYTIDTNLADLQFLYIDLFLITILALTFGRTDPYEGTLVKQPPSATLVSLPPIISILLHMLTVIGFQLAAFFYVQQQSWFVPYVPQEDVVACFQNYAVFAVSAFQYIIMAVVFSQGSPYRKGFWTNKMFMAALISLTALTCYIVLYPPTFLINTLELELPPEFGFRLTMIGFAGANFFMAIFIELFIVNMILSRKRSNKSEEAKRGYMQIDQELSEREDWPPVSPFTPTSFENTTKAQQNMVDFSKRKTILPNDNGIKAHTLERSSLTAATNNNNKNSNGTVNGRAPRRHSSSVSIPIPMADCLGHQPQLLAASMNQSSDGDSLDNDNNDIIATHINNSLNDAGFTNDNSTGNNSDSHAAADCRIPMEIMPPSPPTHHQS